MQRLPDRGSTGVSPSRVTLHVFRHPKPSQAGSNDSKPPHYRKLTENLRQGLRTIKIHRTMSRTPRLIQFSSWAGIQDWADPHWVEVNNGKTEKGNCQVTASLNQIMSVIFYKIQTPKAVSHLGAVR